MPHIELGNITYFVVMFGLIALVVILYFIFARKSKDTQKTFLLIWAFINFALHFIKQLFYWKSKYLYTSTAENICAVSTLVLPFILMIKKDSFIKDTVFLLSFLGGLAALIYPTEVIAPSKHQLTEFGAQFDVIRFYFCHFSLFGISLLAAIFNINRPKLKNFYLVPLGVLVYLTIICINTGIICFTNLISFEGFTQEELFWSKEFLNGSFVFGPTDDMGAAGRFFAMLCPNFMKVDYLGISNGLMKYWPVLWMLFPSYVIFTPLYLLICFPFFIVDHKKKQLLKS